ncbi:MAG: cupin domain-containing protein [Gemmatimonadales bacterium]|nr:MAG: cupin domain-containing protein [Gemmatimonadales bacterium]
MRHRIPTAALGVVTAVLVAACSTESPNESVIDRAPTETSASAAPAHAGQPPVTGQPAFTRTIDDPQVEWGPCFDWMPAGCELAIVQGLDPDGLNVDAFFKLPPGSTVPEHYHTSAERMVLLSGVLEVDYEGQDPVRVLPGTYAYGPPELPHETHCMEGEGEACVLFIAFEEPVDAIEGQPDETPDQSAFTWTHDDADLEWDACPDFMPEGCELAVIQALDGDGLNADALFKLEPGTTVPMHWHTSAERMVLLSGELRVNYQGQPPVEFGPLTYAYGPPGLPHETRCGEREACVLFIAFEEPVDAVDVRGGDLPHRR